MSWSAAPKHRNRRLGIVVGSAVAGLLVIITGVATPRAEARQRTTSSRKVLLAQATTVTRGFSVSATTGSREAALGSAALDRVRVNYQNMFPGWTVAFLPAKAGLLGLTLTRERRVEIYVRLDRSVDGVAHDIAHEFGHVADVVYNNSEKRSQYLQLRGLPDSTPWWTCNECRDMQVGAGDFAETFALIAAPAFHFYSEVGPKSNAEALNRIAAEILPAGLVRAAL